MPTTNIDLGGRPASFFNGTPHPVNIYIEAELGPDRKWHGGECVAVIPPSGTMLSAQLGLRTALNLGMGITVAEQSANGCDPLPSEAREADFVIVSALYAIAYRKIHGADEILLVTPRDIVVDDSGKIIGCCGFALN